MNILHLTLKTIFMSRIRLISECHYVSAPNGLSYQLYVMLTYASKYVTCVTLKFFQSMPHPLEHFSAIRSNVLN